MAKLGRFQKDQTGMVAGKVALAAAVLGVTSVFVANVMSAMLQSETLLDGRTSRAIAARGVDMSATGSVPARRPGAGPARPHDGRSK
jgi:hypothetical protein